MPKYRILFVLDSIATGGAEFSTLLLARDLISSGYKIKIAVLKKSNQVFEIEKFNLKDTDLFIPKNSDSKINSSFKWIKQIIKEYQPEIVHSVLFESNLICRFLRFCNGGFKHVESLVNASYSKEKMTDPNVAKYKILAVKYLDWITGKFGVDLYHSNAISVSNHYNEKLGIPIHKMIMIPRGKGI